VSATVRPGPSRPILLELCRLEISICERDGAGDVSADSAACGTRGDRTAAADAVDGREVVEGTEPGAEDESMVDIPEPAAATLRVCLYTVTVTVTMLVLSEDWRVMSMGPDTSKVVYVDSGQRINMVGDDQYQAELHYFRCVVIQDECKDSMKSRQNSERTYL
jgi:hypothetical protein